MSTLNVDLYWSFRSPFSYLLIGMIKPFIQRYDMTVSVKPVYPLVIRVPDYFQKADPRFFSYLLKDVARTAQMIGADFSPAQPDPIIMNPETRMAAPQQPYIYRLNRIAAAAAQQADIFPLIDEIGSLIWSGAVKAWDQGNHLHEATARAGFDLDTLDAQAASEAETLDALLAQNQADLEAAGHWGVPTLVFQGEPFFGHDRLDLLIWRMKQHGLRARSSTAAAPA